MELVAMLNFLLGILAVNIYITYRYFKRVGKLSFITPTVVLIFIAHIFIGFVWATESHMAVFDSIKRKIVDDSNE